MSTPTLVRVRLVTPKTLEIQADFVGGLRTHSKVDLDAELGNRNGVFAIGHRRFSLSARRVRLSPNMILECELCTLSKTWRRAAVALEIKIGSDNVPYVIKSVVEPHEATIAFRSASNPSGMPAREMSLSGSVLTVRVPRGNHIATGFVDLNLVLGNYEGHFETRGTHLMRSTRNVTLTGNTLCAELATSQLVWKDRSLDLGELFDSGGLPLTIYYDMGQEVSPFLERTTINERALHESAVYEDLRSISGCTRCCYIRPDDWDTPIRCHLFARDIVDVAPYRALSYVWGDRDDQETIFVNGCRFAVTRNLFLILKRLRSRKHDIPFWIDAICINQANMVEKAAQVAQMAAIYSRAMEVLIWLGDESDQQTEADPRHGSPFACLRAILPSLRDGAHLQDLPGLYDDGHDGEERVDSVMQKRLQLGLERIRDSPWFERMWTVQEMVLSHNATVLFGNEEFPWVDLLSALRNAFRHVRTGCCDARTLAVEHYGRHADCLSTIGWRIIYIDEVAWVIPAIMSRSLPIEEKWVSALGVMAAFWHRSASNAVDKIWGLYGCLFPVMGSFKPDYEMSESLVFSRFSALAISQMRCFDIWDYLFQPTADSTTPLTEQSFPSWAVNWGCQNWLPGTKTDEYDRAPVRALSSSMRNLELFRRQPQFSEIPSVLEDRILIVKARRLDIITKSSAQDGGDALHELQKEDLQLLRTWRDFVQDHARDSTYHTGESHEQVFWRTICLDHVMQPWNSIPGTVVTVDLRKRKAAYRRTRPEQDRHAWDDIRQDLYETQDAAASDSSINCTPEAVREVSSLLPPRIPLLSDERSQLVLHRSNNLRFAICNTISAKKLILTERGYIGLAARTVLPGDEVFIVEGSSAPCIFRKKLLHTDGERPRTIYSVVGRCYLHGFMDGEDASPLEPVESIQLR